MADEVPPNPMPTDLTVNQVRWIRKFADAFHRPGEYARHPASDVVNDAFLQLFGDSLRINHCLSAQPMTKDKFEYAMEECLLAAGRTAVRSTNCLPGQDITVDGVNWSLKTQADKSMREHSLHISKLMELGKGKWSTEDDLQLLLGRYLEHLGRYERIFSLRYFRTTAKTADKKLGKTVNTTLPVPDIMKFQHRYEFVEIPKALLLRGGNCPVRMVTKTRQTDHPPAYCVT